MKKGIGTVLLFTLGYTLSLQAFADWQCYVKDKKGHLWTSPGLTQENARAVAQSFCTGFSPNGGCRVTQCYEKT